MKWIGLTGGIASGKSTVSTFLRELGVPVVDADVLAREAVQPGSAGLQAVVKHFGPGVLQADQSLDRKKLAAQVFGHPEELAALEKIVHPIVQQKLQAQKAQLAQQHVPLAVYDVPLLFEKNMQSQFDRIVVVTCSREEQLKRLMARDRLTPSQAEARLRSQMPLSAKAALADEVLENSGTDTELRSRTQALVTKLLATNF